MKPVHILLAVMIAMVWGINFVFIKLGVSAVPPFLLTGLRFLFSAFPAVLFVQRPKESWVQLASFGIMLSVGQFGFLFLAVRLGLPAGLTSIVMQVQAFYTILFAWFVLSEIPKPIQLWGAAIAFLGIGVIGYERWAGPDAVPLILCLIAAAGWAAANIIAKAAKPANALSFIVWSSLFAPIPLFVLSALFEDHAQSVQAIIHPSLIVVISLVYLVVLSTIFGFGTWNALLARYPASTVAPFSLLVPLFGIASGAVVFGERFDAYEIVGAILIIGGLVFSNFGPRLLFAKKEAEPKGSAN